jgi:hypothetical protein
MRLKGNNSTTLSICFINNKSLKNMFYIFQCQLTIFPDELRECFFPK